MPIPISGQVGEQILGNGVTSQPLRQGALAELIVSELNGRFYEQVYRGRGFSGGMQLTSIANATFTTADALSGTLATAATTTPILGLWNPSTSGVNAVILQAIVETIITALQVTGPGGYVWCVYNGQVAPISTGLLPINRKTFASVGSAVKNLAGVALTGLQNTGAFLGASGLGNPALNLSTLQTAIGLMPANGAAVENIDGSIIVPPGGILALVASGTPVAISCAASLLWNEVPV